MLIPRPEYPRPQLVRDEWINLNGEWDFEIDNEKSGREKKFFEQEGFSKKIIVPFCPESSLSGIGNTGFMDCVWYKRQVELKGVCARHVILHFGAVDYHAVIYVNGTQAGEHKGGYSSFSVDITKFVKDGMNDITVCAFDELRSENQPSGKQSHQLNSYGCCYTRTTGIWQTVWLELVGESHIKSVNYICEPENKRVVMAVKTTASSVGCRLKVKALWEGKEVGQSEITISSAVDHVSVDLSEIHMWDIGQGNLYDVALELLRDGKREDYAESYFGLRTVGLDKKAFLLNGRRVFGRWVLDQGFYPDGIYTAPTDEALKNDILYSMQLGFNGARLHEKVFEPRFLYWADKLGYMVWGEQGNWGLRITELSQIEHFLPEWLETVERDIAHPSVIGWCPFNETWDYMGYIRQNDMLLKIVYDVTKAIDPTRPVIDTSGNFHVATDIFDVHDYEQDPEVFAEKFTHVDEGIIKDQIYCNFKGRQSYNGEPVFVSEYGGIRWAPEADEGWGYGDAPKTEEEFLERYKLLTEALLNNPDIMGFCYTQLYDVEQEVNGLMTYNREFKFDPEIIGKINKQKAAIEKITE